MKNNEYHKYTFNGIGYIVVGIIFLAFAFAVTLICYIYAIFGVNLWIFPLLCVFISIIIFIKYHIKKKEHIEKMEIEEAKRLAYEQEARLARKRRER